jgi:ADP-ribose pyrophosphatase
MGEILSSQTVHQGRVIRVRVDRIRLPGGRTTALDIVDHPGSVAIVPLTGDGGIYFVRQYRLAAGRELLELPAGTLENGEEPKTCADRELQEETGFSARRLEKIGSFYLAPGYCTEWMHVFLARDLSPSRLPGDEDEILHVVRQSELETRHMLARGSLEDAKTIAALALYFQREATA